MSEAGADDGPIVVATYAGQGVLTRVAVGEQELIADEPADLGGGNAGPTPFEYLFTALASCMVVTAAMYARRKDWPVESIELLIYPTFEGYRMTAARAEVKIAGELSNEQIGRLVQIVDKCPVHQTLEHGVTFEPAQLIQG